MKTFLTLAILSSVAAAPAMAERFTRDGEAYEYAVKSYDGYQLITGTNLSTGAAFNLRVKGAQVSGNYAGSPVSFRAEASDLASGGAAVFAAK